MHLHDLVRISNPRRSSCSVNYLGIAKSHDRCLSFRMYVFDVVRVANNVDEPARKGINIVCEMRALMNDKKITSENAFVTVTVSQLEERIDRSSLIRPHTPGLERATRRYRIVIAEQKGDRYRLTCSASLRTATTSTTPEASSEPGQFLTGRSPERSGGSHTRRRENGVRDKFSGSVVAFLSGVGSERLRHQELNPNLNE